MTRFGALGFDKYYGQVIYGITGDNFTQRPLQSVYLGLGGIFLLNTPCYSFPRNIICSTTGWEKIKKKLMIIIIILLHTSSDRCRGCIIGRFTLIITVLSQPHDDEIFYITPSDSVARTQQHNNNIHTSVVRTIII